MLSRIISKFTSIRSIVTLIIILTYSKVCFELIELCKIGILKVEFLEGFITGSLGSLVLVIIKDYFNRDDRILPVTTK